MKPLSSCLSVALLLLAAVSSGRACQYCQLAAAGDPEAARMVAQIHGQDFPLDRITSRYAPAAPSAILSRPPAAASVATRASDLPAPVVRRAAPPPSAVVKSTPVPSSVQPSPVPAAVASSRWANAGLLGLLAASGLFCWRTRRATAPQP